MRDAEFFFAIKKGRRNKQEKKSLSFSLRVSRLIERRPVACPACPSTRYAWTFTRRDVDGNCIGNSERRIYTSINVITRRRAAARRIRSCVSLIYIRFIHKERERGYIILCDIDADLGARFSVCSLSRFSFSFSLNRGVPMPLGSLVVCFSLSFSSFSLSH